MGMYTEFHFNAELKSDLPPDIRRVLDFMLGEAEKPEALPDHDLFKTSRWSYMLRCSSAYFDAPTKSEIEESNYGDRVLSVRSNFKNYENEISLFVDWIAPYLNKYEGEFLGFSRYEESEDPEIIKMPKLAS